MAIDFTLADRVTAFINANTTKHFSRDQMYRLLVQKGLICKDGTATPYAKKHHILN